MNCVCDDGCLRREGASTVVIVRKSSVTCHFRLLYAIFIIVVIAAVIIFIICAFNFHRLVKSAALNYFHIKSKMFYLL